MLLGSRLQRYCSRLFQFPSPPLLYRLDKSNGVFRSDLTQQVAIL